MLSKKQKIVVGAVLVLLVVAVIGYRPMRHSMLVSDLAKGSKSAAQTLFNDQGWRGGSVSLFARYLKPAATPEEQAQRTAGTPVAAAYGLGLAIRSSTCRDLALGKAKELLESGPDETRRPLAAELKTCADYVLEKREGALMTALVPVLLQCVDAQDQEVRLAGLYGLGRYEAPNGGCLRLLKVAREEKDPFRGVALSGIEMSATPEAIEHLLNTMSQQEDKPLAEAALKGFTKVRDEAKTASLLSQLTNSSSEVRLEIVKALALRKADEQAGGGIVRALSDDAAPIRVEAVRAFPGMRIDSREAAKLEPLITDANEDVRVATAKTLMALSDDTSWKMLMGAFGKDVQGKTLEALLQAVAKRGYNKGKDGRRNLQITRVLVDLFDKHPASAEASSGKDGGSAEAIAKALAELTALSRYPHRFAQRQKWDAAQWKGWQENAEKREALIQDAVGKLNDAREKQNMEFRDQFAKLLKQVDNALETLEKAKAMCAEDPEDEDYCDSMASHYMKMRYHFQKDQAIDMGPR